MHATQASTTGANCDDITKLDFRNLNFRAAGRILAFHNGVAESGPSEQISVAGQADSRHEWKAEIEQDSVLRPTADVSVRFLLIHDSHQTGSGWRFYLLGFRCSGGKLEEVFHREELSLSVERLDATGVTVGMVAKDGGSNREYWQYNWNGQRYVLASKQ
jgi:hypothetical protein